MSIQVNLDMAAVEDMLNSPDGPVGTTILELAEQATSIAKLNAPLQKPWNWSWSARKSTSYVTRSVGYLKGGIRVTGIKLNKVGQIYSGVNAPYGPTLFLQQPARQIHSMDYMFMSVALNSVVLV